jgi:outer membrane receptor protein involved in Fe transport
MMASTLLIGAAVVSTPTFAQTTETASTAAEEESILVTGSRIARPELESASPVTVVDDEQIALDGSQNISDILNELPQVGLGSTRTNTNFLTSGTGIATVNLRALGSSRTLTLVNGRRFISGFAGDSAVDLNNIPTDFIQRIEVVTGGSSAVYGSDAVAGVVNFILKDSFEGVSLRAQSSVTEEGDNPRYYVSATAGTTFGGDDRGNILVNFSYDKDEGLSSRNRARSAQDCANLLCGPGSYSSYAPQGQFQLVSASGAPVAALPNGGSVFSFNPDNSLALLTGYNTGAYGYNRNNDRYISVPLERYLATGVANYDITDGIEAFAEVTYAKVTSNSSLEPYALSALSDIYYRAVDPYGMPITNPFIPATVAAAIAARNSDANPANDVDAIDFRRRQNDVFDRSNTVERNTWRVAVGLRGDVFERFKWEASYVYGYMNDYNASEDIDNNRYRQALDAIQVGTGNVVGVNIICRDPSAVAAGCIPLNPFGFNTVDPRAAAYVQAVVPKSEEITNQQHVATFSVSGPLATLWAGDIGAAVGFEYREEKTQDDLDILTNTGGNSGNQIPDLQGGFRVWEAFGELNVPLLRDVSFVQYFGLIGAARYSDYSTIGSTFSWNAGAEWEPINGLRFRGVYAVANRAPNNGELFSQPSETFAAVTDPCDLVTATSSNNGYGDACRAIPAIAAQITADGTFNYTLADTQGINGFIGGNQALQEETAKTLTIGGVISPALVPGLSITVDYFDIKIDQAISTLGRSYSIAQCLETGLSVYCGNVFRSSTTGFVTRVDGQLINVAGFGSRGVDVGVRYSRALGLASEDKLTFSGNYTYLIKFTSQADPASPVSDFAGTFGPSYSTHRFSGRLTYAVDEFSLSWATNFLSGGPYSLTPVSANAAVQALNDISDYWLHDAQVRWDMKEGFSLYFGVDNVFNTKPPYLPGTPFGTPTGLETGAEFDVFGRRFTAGARVRF